MKKWRVVSNADAVIQVITRGDHALLTSVELARASEAWLWVAPAERIANCRVCGERGEYNTCVSKGTALPLCPAHQPGRAALHVWLRADRHSAGSDIKISEIERAVSESDVTRAVAQLIGIQPRIVSLSPYRLADVWEDVLHVGATLQRAAQAEELVANYQTRLERILRAVRNGRAFAIDGNRYFNRSGPRLVESAEILASLLFAKDMADGIDHTSWQNIAEIIPMLNGLGT